jgi:chromosome segregation protein
MVSQGRVGAIIAAKPEQRRLLLEEAAGITGLHSRRHDAELRLSSTENNLVRVKDVLNSQEEQLELLKKQSRQAKRYKNIQNDINRARATIFYQRWEAEKEKLKELKNKHVKQENLVSNQTQIVASCNIEYENIQQQLPKLRQQESKAITELQKNSINLENQEKEIERANNSIEEIQIRIEQINNDVSREQFLIDFLLNHLIKIALY